MRLIENKTNAERLTGLEGYESHRSRSWRVQVAINEFVSRMQRIIDIECVSGHFPNLPSASIPRIVVWWRKQALTYVQLYYQTRSNPHLRGATQLTGTTRTITPFQRKNKIKIDCEVHWSMLRTADFRNATGNGRDWRLNRRSRFDSNSVTSNVQWGISICNWNIIYCTSIQHFEMIYA